jgi:serine/threonine protein kinase
VAHSERRKKDMLTFEKDEDINNFEQLLLICLKYNPDERLDAEELLWHPFLHGWPYNRNWKPQIISSFNISDLRLGIF